ncbi:hypothetical protein MML48_3g00010618 [Holotrichia oblita]|uniref:Uncharacterized protein n=1 Tax=Holotrichia oblita TaxID=644536 RepID=A0ACB9THA6_HOLOL|nr:hypothetical protein MML48_3g00010618 [Holotrichia oblita]
MNNYTAPQKQNIQAEKGEQKPFPIIMYVFDSGKKKREWVHKINLDPNKFGKYHTFMPQLQEDEKRFYIYFRMPSECFEEILCSTKEDISKQITNYRVPVSVEERLVLTLRFDLAAEFLENYRVLVLTMYDSYVGYQPEYIQCLWAQIIGRKKIDGGIFEASNMGQRFEAGQMNVPKYSPLPGENKRCSHVLVGDEAFALKPYLMRYFPYQQSRIERA